MVEVIAEFGQACRGELDVAIAQADAAKEAGCAWAKWQTFQPERLCSPLASRYWSSHLGGAATQYQTFVDNGMLKSSDWKVLAQHCADIGTGFLSSPFDLEAVDLLMDAGARAFKVASGEITHKQLLRRIAETGLPVFLSTGAATVNEIAQAMVWLRPVVPILLACTLSYPTADGDAQLGRIQMLKRAFPYGPVGYSDHTVRTDTALAAVVAGATVLEKHCTLDAGGGVPDDRMALGPGRLRQYVVYAQLGEQMRGDGRLVPTEAEMAARVGARRSLHAARNIMAGETFRVDDFMCLRPGDGIVPAEVDSLVGKTAAVDIPAGVQIKNYDIVM